MQLLSPVLLPFLIPIGVVIAFTALQVALVVLTGLSLGLEVDGDLDLDADVDVDVDVDLDMDADLDVDADMDADVDVDADGDVGAGGASGPGFAQLVLTPLGVGQVPLSVIAQAYALAWGVVGVAVSYALYTVAGGPHAWFLGVACPAALVGGWFITRRLVRLVAPLLRISGQAESMCDLVGRQGVVTSLRVDGEFGEVRILVNGAPNYTYVKSRGEVIPRGGEVVVVGYDVDAHRPLVASTTTSVSTSEGV